MVVLALTSQQEAAIALMVLACLGLAGIGGCVIAYKKLWPSIKTRWRAASEKNRAEGRINNAMAVTGFSLGVVSVFLFFLGLLPLLAIIFSSIGLGTFKHDIHKNRWMAITGLVLGIIYSLMAMLFWGAR